MSLRFIIFMIFVGFITYKSFKDNPIYLVILLVVMYIIYPEKYIWGLKEWRIVLLMTILLALTVAGRYGKFFSINDSISCLMVLLCLSFFYSAFNAAVDPKVALDTAVIFLKLLIFWMLLKIVLCSTDNISMFYWSCMGALSFLSLWGVQQYILGNSRLEGFGGGQLMGSNQLAAAFVWGIPIAYYFIFLLKLKKHRIISTLCLLVLLAGVVCTQSRQGFLALLVYLVLVFISSERKIAIMAFFIVVIGFTGAMAPSGYFERMETIQDYEEDTSAVGRLEQWKAATQVWIDHPISGVGARNYFLIAHRYTEHPRVTHNTFFQILSEEGTIGILLFISIIALTLTKLNRIIKFYRKKERSEEEDKLMYFALISRMSLIGILVCCMFQNKAEHEILYWSSAIASALTMIIYEQSEKKTPLKQKGALL